MIECTFVFIPIVPHFIKNALESLYKFTKIEFRVVVVDQTRDGVFQDIQQYVDLYIRPKRNLGFSKANNEGILHGIHWGSKFIAACNDDILFLDERYWQGLMDQFKQYPEMLAVCPASPIEPGWGYGIGLPNHPCPDWGVVVGKDIYPKGKDGKPITLEMAQTKEGYDALLAHRQGHIEGFAGWFVVGRREMWEKVGLYDERFYPGGGEDYDLVHRIYMAGGRASATMRSFIWHFWGKSKDVVFKTDQALPLSRKTFQDTNALFEYSPSGATSPIYPPREEEPLGNKRTRKVPVFVDDIR